MACPLGEQEAVRRIPNASFEHRGAVARKSFASEVGTQAIGGVGVEKNLCCEHADAECVSGSGNPELDSVGRHFISTSTNANSFMPGLTMLCSTPAGRV